MLDCCLAWSSTCLMQVTQLLWLHECSGPVVCRRCCLTLALPDLWLLHILHPFFLGGCWALGRRYNMVVPLGAELSTGVCYLHFHELWASAVTTISCTKGFIWGGLTAASLQSLTLKTVETTAREEIIGGERHGETDRQRQKHRDTETDIQTETEMKRHRDRDREAETTCKKLFDQALRTL